jgi:hypothetical protein
MTFRITMLSFIVLVALFFAAVMGWAVYHGNASLFLPALLAFLSMVWTYRKISPVPSTGIPAADPVRVLIFWGVIALSIVGTIFALKRWA